MSSQKLLKAELKARHSSRELEHSLDHLGVKLEEGAEKALVLRARATEVSFKIRHPSDTLFKYMNELSQGAWRSVQGWVERVPLEKRPLLVGLTAGTYIFGMFLAGRRKRKKDLEVSVIPMEQVRIFVEAA